MQQDNQIPYSQQVDLFFDLLSESTDDYVFIWDIQNGTFKVSESIFKEFNLNPLVYHDITTYWTEIMYSDDVAAWREEIEKFLRKETKNHNMEYRLINKKGKVVWVSCRGAGHENENGQIVLLVGRISHIGKQNKFDDITGTLNRIQFELEINEALASPYCDEGAIVIFDVDNFKNINEKHGHLYGDKVLKAIATKITSLLPSQIKLYRLDGDEFSFFYPLASIDKDKIKELYCALQLYMNANHLIDGKKYFSTLSAGVSFFPKDGSDFIHLFQHTHSALDISKMTGKNRLTFFSSSIHSQKLKVIEMEQSLRECVENNFDELELYYQPQVDPVRKRLAGAEALLRWHSKQFGEVSPVEFIPIMEESSLIVPVGKWVIEQAVAQCKEWQKICGNFAISVNVSYIQLKENDLKDFLNKCLAINRLDASAFVLELTENCWVPDLNFLNKDFSEYQSMGVNIAIDDFGTGYSSLNYLKELPVNIIKIDKSFVENICKDNYEYTFLEYIIKLAHIINLQVCIEGIETYDQYKIVKRLNPDLIQGYLYGKPQNATDFYKKYFVNDKK